MAKLAPLPRFTPNKVKTLAAVNRRIGILYGISTVPWLDRHYNGTGDPRLVMDTAKIQRLLGLPATGRLDGETLARMLAHIQANTGIGAALRRNFVFPGHRTGFKVNVRRPTTHDLQVARLREVYLKMPAQKKTQLARRASGQQVITRNPITGRPATRTLLYQPRQTQPSTVRPLVAQQTRPSLVPRPAPLIFTRNWWANFRAAQARRRAVQAQRRCICGGSRAELQARLASTRF